MREQLYERAVAVWGEGAQCGMVIEEVGGLLVGLNHWMRGRQCEAELLEEVADVRIMLDQLVHIVDAKDGEARVAELVEGKLRRLEGRLAEEERSCVE